MTVDGLEIGPATDFAQLFRQAMTSGDTVGPVPTVDRLIAALKGTPQEARLLDAVIDLLLDPVLEVRTQALSLAERYAVSLNPTRLLVALDVATTQFRGVPAADESPPVDLEWKLLRVMAQSLARRRYLVEEFGDVVLNPGKYERREPTRATDRAGSTSTWLRSWECIQSKR